MEDETILPKTNPQSPFHTGVPVDSQPTETLSKRFELWRQILKSLINYFKCVVISNREFSKINANIVNQISFPFFTDVRPKVKSILKNPNISSSNISLSKEQLKPTIKEKLHKHTKSLSKSQISLLPTPGHSENPSPLQFEEEKFDLTENAGLLEIVEPSIDNRKKQSFFNGFGNGSVQDLQVLLKKYHLNLSEQQLLIAKELELKVLPTLEDFQKDLFEKCKEIKLLSSDFKNSLNNEIAITGQILNDYIHAVKNVLDGKPVTKDPFLLRLRLELQIKQQLNQENYLEEAYINLQTTGMELEKIVYQTISDSLNKYGELISQEIFVYYNDLINELHQGLISKPTHYEWDKFIDKTKGKVLLDLKHDQPLPKPRKLSDLKYPYNKSIVSKTVRSGYFNKKSKLFKNYSRSFFLLTLTHLHEFKSSNLVENFEPIHSFNLNDCILVEINDHKFQLNVMNNRDLNNIVFKKVDEMDSTDFRKWALDLKKFTSFNSFSDRFQYYSLKISNTLSNDSLMTKIGKMNLSTPTLNLSQVQSPYSANLKRPGSTPPTAMLSTSNNKVDSGLKPRLQISSLPKFEIQEPSPIQPHSAPNVLTSGVLSASSHSLSRSSSPVRSGATTPTRLAGGVSRPGSPKSGPSAQQQSPRGLTLALTHTSTTPINSPGLTPMFEEEGANGYFDMDFKLGQSLYNNDVNNIIQDNEENDQAAEVDEQERLERVLEELNKNRDTN